MTIQQVKKELGLIDKDIAEFFQYANGNSYATSARKEKLDHGIIRMFLKCKEHFNSNNPSNKLYFENECCGRCIKNVDKCIYDDDD